MAKGRKKFDWAAIEQEYCAGQLSQAEISEIYGPTRQAIYLRARKEGWKRDLTEQVQAAAKARLLTDSAEPDKVLLDSVKQDVKQSPATEDKEIISTAAERMVAVVRDHRGLAKNLRKLSEEIAQELSIEDLNPAAKASALRALTGAAKDIIAIERQAFNIDAENGKSDEKAVPLHERLGRLRRQAAISAAENVEELGPVTKPIAPPVAPPAKINGKARA